jgi:hypothetical protein
MKKKQQLDEQEQLNEFLGALVKAVFKSKATKLGAAAFADPRLKNAFEDYIKDTKEFKDKLKRIGVTSSADLKKAIEKSPNIDADRYGLDWE